MGDILVKYNCTAGSWPHRLTARTSGSHPGNRGSIPREVTLLGRAGIENRGSE